MLFTRCVSGKKEAIHAFVAKWLSHMNPCALGTSSHPFIYHPPPSPPLSLSPSWGDCQGCGGLAQQQTSELDRLSALADAAQAQISDARRDTASTLREAEKLANRLQGSSDEAAALTVRIKTQAHLLDMGKAAYDAVRSERGRLWRRTEALKLQIKVTTDQPTDRPTD